MSGAVFQYDRKGQYLSLWYEDDFIALDTGRVGSLGGLEIMLDAPTVDALIEALQTMKTKIEERFPKETQS